MTIAATATREDDKSVFEQDMTALRVDELVEHWV